VLYFFSYIKDVYERFSKAQGSLLAKGIAYSLILATIPFLLLFIYVSSVVLKQNGELSRLLLEYLVNIIPLESAEYLSQRLISYINIDSWKGIGISGVIMLVFIPHTLFFSIEQALSKVMRRREKRAIHHQIAFTLFFQFLLLTLLFIFINLSIFTGVITEQFKVPFFYKILSSNTISIFMITGMLIAVYRVSYGAYLRRRFLVLISLAVSIIWEVFNNIGATIITVSGKNELLYGLFAGGIVLMVWTYIFALLVLIGGIVIAKETEHFLEHSSI
jgi:membrane protein